MSAEWTFLVYLAGDNNLEAFGERDLLEMKRVGSTEALRVVAQFDRMGDGVTRRYCLTRGGPLAADVVAELPETNTGDPAALRDFIRWGMAEYPAERVALILWNHGSGWKDDDIYALGRQAGLSEAELPRSLIRGAGRRRLSRSLFTTSIRRILEYPASIRGILFDDTSKDFLDNRELKSVLDDVLFDRKGRKLDLVGFDACLMSMIEVATEVEHACDYMVGSQEIEPGDGWPYDRILAALAANPTATGDRLGQIIVDAYVDYYVEHPSGMAVTQSSLRLRHVPGLVESVGRLADGLIERLSDPAFYGQALLPAMRRVQKFRDQQYVDLRHLARLLGETGADSDLREVAREVDARLDPATVDSVVGAARAASGQARSPAKAPLRSRHLRGGSAHPEVVPGAHGLSIYVPFLGPLSPAYAELQFARNCRWGQFLEAFGET